MTQYCVVYRTGGTENFRWNRTLPQSREDCYQTAENVKRQGYKAHVELYERSLAIGLPETFSFRG